MMMSCRCGNSSHQCCGGYPKHTYCFCGYPSYCCCGSARPCHRPPRPPAETYPERPGEYPGFGCCRPSGGCCKPEPGLLPSELFSFYSDKFCRVMKVRSWQNRSCEKIKNLPIKCSGGSPDNVPSYVVDPNRFPGRFKIVAPIPVDDYDEYEDLEEDDDDELEDDELEAEEEEEEEEEEETPPPSNGNGNNNGNRERACRYGKYQKKYDCEALNIPGRFECVPMYCVCRELPKPPQPPPPPPPPPQIKCVRPKRCKCRPIAIVPYIDMEPPKVKQCRQRKAACKYRCCCCGSEVYCDAPNVTVINMPECPQMPIIPGDPDTVG